MYENNHAMLEILNEDVGTRIPVKSFFARTKNERKHEHVWANGLGGDAVATIVSLMALAALVLVG